MTTRNYLVPLLLKHNTMRGLKGEAGICADIVTHLKAESIEGKLPFVWCHVPNEYAGQNKPVYGAKQATIGKICGMSDYLFLGQYGAFGVEVKYGKQGQSESQLIVEKWFSDVRVPYYLCRSLKEVEKVLEIERVKQETIHQIVSKAISGLDVGIREDEGGQLVSASPRHPQTLEKAR